VLRQQAAHEALSAPEVKELALALSQTFQHLQAVSRKSARAGEEAVIDDEFLRSWHELQALLSSFENRRNEHTQTGKE